MLHSLQFYVNGVVVYLNEEQNNGAVMLKGNIPAAAFEGSELDLKFVTIPFTSPMQRGIGGDARSLGLALDWITISIAN